eukprot:CAMPEP_0169275330 /NCGR_PEP_ID=MMETSP1016-20121227/52301_1 /TAXON_ID=342587 /ORGANISM="Karlodinium micrum, Strain CCMP2283" /LENGTH=73 /DNA_ID=CAMNT_0009362151 /DNA_START=94 /DNA_END=315 /DNA_ORIENTATION=-
MSSGQRTSAETTTLEADARITALPGEMYSGGTDKNLCFSISYEPIRTAHAGIIEKAAADTPRYKPRAPNDARV